VTGNNDKHLLRFSTATSEPIYRGKDIAPFSPLSPSLHIEFNPSIYQQVAPVELYRHRKIIYRFIADRLVCAIDTEGRLLLNSANLFIPASDYPWETIVVLFNSGLYAFLYKKLFNSKKVLRSHIESLPLPVLTRADHTLFKEWHDVKISTHREIRNIDAEIYRIFELSPLQIQLIERNAGNGKAD
jgi:hypothetical protein